MENKNVGYLVLGIAAILVVIIFLYQNALKEIVAVGCDMGHGLECPMYQTINQQTYLALAIVGVLIVIAGFLILTKQPERLVIRKVKEKTKSKKLNLEGLDKDEKQIIKLLQEENGGMFQATLKEKLDTGKVKLTRLLDKLEAKQLIERKRRGMNNIVVLKS